MSIEDALSSIETIEIDENLYQKIKNGAIIEKIFKNNIACLKYNNKIVAIYKEYEKSKMKPFLMF